MKRSGCKKRRPSFRRLLKTSGVKLENKVKNKQMKQQNVDKKQRKEQKKLRQALKSSSSSERPLETYCKRPEEEHDDEEFVENLPTDMLEDNDLQQMRHLSQQASFITRDLSSSTPVHSGKKRRSEMIRDYEKIPRKMKKTEEKEVIHLLPIKDKHRLIPQTMERVVETKKEDDEDEDPEDTCCEATPPAVWLTEATPPAVRLTLGQRQRVRAATLAQRKLHIAALGSAIVSEPISSVKRLKELRTMLMEAEPSVAVTVRKMVMVSLVEVFKDIAPTYRIRPLTQDEKNTKVKKETQLLREFEEGLLSQYKFYLEDLEQTIKGTPPTHTHTHTLTLILIYIHTHTHSYSYTHTQSHTHNHPYTIMHTHDNTLCVSDWKQQKMKRSQAVGIGSYVALAQVAVRCLCELLLALPHFNFHNNIIVILVPLMNDSNRTVSKLCCDAFRKLFQQDKVGSASLASVRVVSGLVKSLNYNLCPELLQVLLSLRIKDLRKDLESTTPQNKNLNSREKKMSRMQRKWKKVEEKLQKELLEADASENKEKKLKLHTETLNIVFLIYFRILKKGQKSRLLPAVLEGLAKFAHLINLEFFDDLIVVLQKLIQSGDLSNKESLHCIQTVFTILSGQGEVLNVDPLTFYAQLYSMLPQLHAGAANDDISIVLRCVDGMLTRRRKHVTQQRVSAYVKRLSTLSLHLLHNATIGVLCALRTLFQCFPKCDVLLDNELQGSGLFQPELDQPEHCNAHNTALWELHTLQKHYHPVVRTFSLHVSRGAPSEGSAALNAELSRRSAVELFDDYSMSDMSFNPSVGKAASKKKVD
ncbi:nucleolar complex protein 3 homolog isoform X2 [Gouania willdenowi]|uniref:nucleolar complex protein 3 homolog isoform X2 n=1 Tax=Gouania willdenowi TaxID=441366 RepID=UPI0010561867|nr:nucleolar complex protein 3 homolog isoform X2 [Gouania willdenowi]